MSAALPHHQCGIVCYMCVRTGGGIHVFVCGTVLVLFPRLQTRQKDELVPPTFLHPINLTSSMPRRARVVAPSNSVAETG